MCEHTGVDRADGGLHVEAVEAELALVGGAVRQRLGLLGVLLKLLLIKEQINKQSLDASQCNCKIWLASFTFLGSLKS